MTNISGYMVLFIIEEGQVIYWLKSSDQNNENEVPILNPLLNNEGTLWLQSPMKKREIDFRRI